MARGDNRYVNFTFKPDVSAEEYGKLLLKIRELPGVEIADRLHKNSPDKALAAMEMVFVEQRFEAQKVMESLKEIPQLENVELPAQRFLQEGRSR